MDPLIGSSLIGAGASLLGGMFGRKSNKKAAAQQYAQQVEASRLDYERSKEFAQKGVQWRVEDAKKAGLHPLFALGGAGASYSGSAFIPGQAPSGSFAEDAARGVGQAAQALINRPNAYERQQARYERRLQQKLLESQITKTQAETASELRRIAPGVPSAIPPSSSVSGSRPMKVEPQADVAGQDVVVGDDGRIYRVPSFKFDDITMPAFWSYMFQRHTNPHALERYLKGHKANIRGGKSKPDHRPHFWHEGDRVAP